MKTLGLYLGAIAVLGFLILNGEFSEKAYSFFLNPNYYSIIFVLLGLILVFMFLEDKLLFLKSGHLRITYALFFIPLVFYPLFRCYFEIPYIFCHVCPRKCIFGYVRPITVPAVLAINLYNRNWCYNYCPSGSLQDEQAKCGKKRAELPEALGYIKYLALTLLVAAYFLILDARRNFSAGNLYDLMFKDSFTTTVWVFIAVFALFMISFSVPRLWCNYLCPIGTTSEVILKGENKILDKI